ncbi:glycosyltransferase family 4 protein [Psychromonas arctica]|uniref:glycosyltransferase family 4 protein n=1 Tax=Psychromonas arctica TaxID=168275 RepID=UPI002FD335CE
MEEKKYTVQKSRLIDSQKNTLFKQLLSRFLIYQIIRVSSLITILFSYKSKKADESFNKKKFVFMGRFESNNWIAAHIKPLAESNVCEHIWIVADKKMLEIENVTYVTPSPIIQKIFGNTFARTYTAYKVTKKNKVDYVGGFHLLLNGIFANVIARMNATKSIYFCVGGWSEIVGGGVYSGTPIFKDSGKHDCVLEKRLINYIKTIDLVVTMGNKAKSYLENKQVENVVVNPGGIDKSVFQNFSKEKNNDLILVARLDPVKRVDRFLTIVEKLKLKLPNISALVVGGGNRLKEYELLSQQLGLNKNVTFTGATVDVTSYLVDSRVFVLTSDSEGLPLSCMEAATLGLPIVASDIGDLSDLVESGKTGYLINKEDISEFVDKLHLLITNKKLAEQVSLDALHKSEKFTLQAASTIWEKAIN